MNLNYLNHFFSLLFLVFCLTAQSQSYFLNGTAQATGNDCYQLTGLFGNQNGTVWYGDQLDLNQPFNIQFRMNFGNLDVDGADGICFVLHTQGTSAIGQNGGGMGYQDFGTSLGIEFDTYQNSNRSDPFYDHVAIQLNGDINHSGANNVAGPVQISPFNENVEDGDDHVVEIRWDPATNALQVYFDCAFRLQGNIDIINQVFNGTTQVWWGFTAATGGLYNNQSVCLQENILSVGDNVTICEGGSTTLSVGASFDGTYSWTPTEGLNDPTSATPIASPTESTIYTCVYTDLCGAEQSASIEVTVAPLVLTMPVINGINCNNPTVNINPTINFTNNNAYVWTNSNNQIVANSISYTANAPGVYTLTASSNGECVVSESIEVIGDFTTLLTNAGPNQVLTCVTTLVSLEAQNAGQGATYQWQGPGVNTNSISATTSQPGTYILTVTNNSNGCSDTDEMVVSQNITPPSIFIPAQDTLDCDRRSLPIAGLAVEDATDYTAEWTVLSVGSFSGAVDINNPVVSSPGIYQVTVTSLINGCESEASVEVFANEYYYLDLSQMRFPNVLSPNGDEMNRGWRPFIASNPEMEILNLFDVYHLRIYNRWGALLEEIESPRTWLPSDFEDGLYYYIFDYSISCGEVRSESLEGNIHLVR